MFPPPPSSMYPPPMLVNCSGCRTPLQLPSGARSIRCALCQAVTHIADPRSAPHPPPPSSASTPPPHIHAPPGQLPHPHGRKRAVICGISYRYSRHELKGCINDAKCMRHLLINKFKFSPDSILMLTGIAISFLYKKYSWIGTVPILLSLNQRENDISFFYFYLALVCLALSILYSVSLPLWVSDL